MKKKQTFHYIYKIHFLCGFPAGRYYIGKRTYRGFELSDDSYTGSGQFCFTYFKKYGAITGVTYIKEIIEINPSKKINGIREKFWIGDLYKTDPLCMNMMPGGLCVISKKGKPTIGDQHSTKIRQYDLDGKFIKEWNSIANAETELGINNIGACCKKRRRKAGGFMWRYSSENIIKLNPKEKNCKQARAVRQYSLDGTFIKEYDRIQDAVLETGISKKGIQECCAHRQSTAFGYIWKYVDENYTRPCNRDLKKCGAKKVIQIDLDGNILNEFVSINEASRKLEIPAGTLQSWIKKGRTTKGFILKLADYD